MHRAADGADRIGGARIVAVLLVARLAVGRRICDLTKPFQQGGTQWSRLFIPGCEVLVAGQSAGIVQHRCYVQCGWGCRAVQGLLVQDGHVQQLQCPSLDLRVFIQELKQAKWGVLRHSVGMLQFGPVRAFDHDTWIRQLPAERLTGDLVVTLARHRARIAPATDIPRGRVREKLQYALDVLFRLHSGGRSLALRRIAR